jgi:hypothetical protein
LEVSRNMSSSSLDANLGRLEEEKEEKTGA